MDIRRADARPGRVGESDYFRGDVRIESLCEAPGPARAFVASVRFEPGARTAWHTHPLGQILIITDGRGWVQRWSGPVEQVDIGDVIWFPPGEKHWHGATATSAMTHISVVERLHGQAAEWLEQVSDEQYHSIQPAPLRLHD